MFQRSFYCSMRWFDSFVLADLGSLILWLTGTTKDILHIGHTKYTLDEGTSLVLEYNTHAAAYFLSPDVEDDRHCQQRRIVKSRTIRGVYFHTIGYGTISGTNIDTGLLS